jgi:class 3 adenylate cyclase
LPSFVTFLEMSVYLATQDAPSEEKAICAISRWGEQEIQMEAPPLERKLVAILAADVAGYSRLMGIDEEGTLATLSAFRLVTDGLIAQHGGRICGTAGDSILAAFGSALAAVQCAVDIQNALAQSNKALEEDRRMQFPASESMSATSC